MESRINEFQTVQQKQCTEAFQEWNTSIVQFFIFQDGDDVHLKEVQNCSDPFLRQFSHSFSNSIVDTNELSRREKLALEKLSRLPLPLQTLLTTLHDVKVDLVTEYLKQLYQYVVKNTKTLEQYYTFLRNACTSCESTTTQFKDRLHQNHANSLSAEFKTHVETFVGHLVDNEIPVDIPENNTITFRWIKNVHKVLQNELQQLVWRSCMPKQHQIGTSVYTSLETTKNALDISKKVRERIQTLSQGHFEGASLSEINFQGISSTSNSEDPIVVGQTSNVSVSKQYTQDKLVDLLQKLQKLAHEYRKLKEKAYEDYQLFVEDMFDTIRKNILLHESEILQNLQCVRIDSKQNHVLQKLVEADQQLQKEIAVIVSTLPVDQSCLDTYLRYIKEKTIVQEYLHYQEFNTNVNTFLKSLKLQLEELFDSFRTNTKLPAL